MRRFFTILLGICIGVIAILMAFFEAGYNYYTARYTQNQAALESLQQQVVEADERGPLAENEGRLVQVNGRARRVSELPVLTDELLGIRIAASSLTRDLTAEERTELGKSTLCDITHPSSAELPSGMRLSAQTIEEETEWEMGGFRFRLSAPRLDVESRHVVPKAEMTPVPDIVQGAEWDEAWEAWSYNKGTLRVQAAYSAAPEEEDMTICGKQEGNCLVPFTYPLPRSLAISAAVMSFTGHDRPREKELPLSEGLLHVLVQGGIDKDNAVFCMGLCDLLLPVLLILVLLLRFCQRRGIWLALLYTGGGVLLLSLLNDLNARWLC